MVYHSPTPSIQEISFAYGFRQAPEFRSKKSCDDMEKLERIGKVYDTNRPSKVCLSEQPKIPRIFHQIWIGPKPVPEYLLRYQSSLKKLHPDFEYHLWCEKSLSTLNLPDWDLVNQASNWGTKADIVKANLLYKFGGIILDADVRVLHSFNDLVYRYSFVAGLENPRPFVATDSQIWMGVAVIGAIPAHPIIQEWRRLIRTGWDESEKISETTAKVLSLTYYPFTKAVMNTFSTTSTADIIFPPTYMHSHIPPAEEALSLHDSAQEWLD